MTQITTGDTFLLGDRPVRRIGYGAMQLAGKGAFGPPDDRDAAIALLRAAVEAGVDHIDTADFYGPHIVNDLIREALFPYAGGLTIVTKVGVRRGPNGAWNPAQDPADLVEQVHDNLRRLGVDVLDVVNLRVIEPEGSVADRFAALAGLQASGLIRHLGLSGVSAAQVAEARAIAPVVCVQNQYNLVHRADDALIDYLAADAIAFVPFFPLSGISPIQSDRLSAVAKRLGHPPQAVALAWLLARAPNILLIPGTSRRAHLDANLAAGNIVLPPDVIAELDAVATPD